MQFIKGGFSYQAEEGIGYAGEVWQRGFSEVRVEDRQSFLKHREYIAQNPVALAWRINSRVVSVLLRLSGNDESLQGLKPSHDFRVALIGTARSRALHNKAATAATVWRANIMR